MFGSKKIEIAKEETKRELKRSMIAAPYFRLRVVVAALLIPAGPFLVLWVFGLGKTVGEHVTHIFIVESMNHPWLLLVVACMPLALVISLLVSLFSTPSQV